MSAVADRELCYRQGPPDIQRGIVRVQAALGAEPVGSGVKIEQFAVFSQGLEAMSKAFRYQQSSVVFPAQNFRVPMQKHWRAPAQVHSDIEHLAAQATHNFSFGMGRVLKVQTSHSAVLCRPSVVYLHDFFTRDKWPKFFGTEYSLEIAALVTDRLALNHLQPLYRRVEDVEAGAHD